jgi:hypothetical protein
MKSQNPFILIASYLSALGEIVKPSFNLLSIETDSPKAEIEGSNTIRKINKVARIGLYDLIIVPHLL